MHVPKDAHLAMDNRLWHSEHNGLAHSPHIRSCVLAKLLQVIVKDLHGAFRVLKQQGHGFMSRQVEWSTTEDAPCSRHAEGRHGVSGVHLAPNSVPLIFRTTFMAGV